MCNKQYMLILHRIKSRQIRLAHPRCSLHQPLHSTFCTTYFQGIQCLNLRTPGLKDLHRLLLFFCLIILFKIFCCRRTSPIFGIFFKLFIINHDRMIIEQIFKSLIKHLKIAGVSVAVKTIVPFYPRCQCTSGQIGRAYIDLASLIPMEDISFGVKRTMFLIIKP